MDQDPAMSLSCRASFSADEQRCGCAATRAGARRGEPNPNARRRTAGPTGGDTGQPSSRKTLRRPPHCGPVGVPAHLVEPRVDGAGAWASGGTARSAGTMLGGLGISDDDSDQLDCSSMRPGFQELSRLGSCPWPNVYTSIVVRCPPPHCASTAVGSGLASQAPKALKERPVPVWWGSWL